MKREEIIRMAQEAGFDHIAEAEYWHPLFSRFAALVANHQQIIDIVKAAEAMQKMNGSCQRALEQSGMNQALAAIQARGEK